MFNTEEVANAANEAEQKPEYWSGNPILDDELADAMINDVFPVDGDPAGLVKLLDFLGQNYTDLSLRNTLDLLMAACYRRSKEYSEGLGKYIKACRDSSPADEASGVV